MYLTQQLLHQCLEKQISWVYKQQRCIKYSAFEYKYKYKYSNLKYKYKYSTLKYKYKYKYLSLKYKYEYKYFVFTASAYQVCNCQRDKRLIF